MKNSYEELKPNRQIFGLSVRWIVVGTALVAVLLIAVYFLGWFAKPLELSSPDNLQRLSREANNAWQALEAKRESINVLEQKAGLMVSAYGEDMTVWPQGKRDEYLQIQSQVTNQKTAYNAACGQYNAFWEDEWRSIPAPNDIPTSCEFLN